VQQEDGMMEVAPVAMENKEAVLAALDRLLADAETCDSVAAMCRIGGKDPIISCALEVMDLHKQATAVDVLLRMMHQCQAYAKK